MTRILSLLQNLRIGLKVFLSLLYPLGCRLGVMRCGREETIPLVKGGSRDTESVQTGAQHPSPQPRGTDGELPQRQKDYRPSPNGRYFIRSGHLLPLGFLASRVPQVRENGNEEGNQLGVRNEFDLGSWWLKGEETPRIPALSRK